MSVTDTSNKRYIITAPPSDFILLPSDMVFVLMQFDQGTEYQPLLAGQAGGSQSKDTYWRPPVLQAALALRRRRGQWGGAVGRGGRGVGRAPPDYCSHPSVLTGPTATSDQLSPHYREIFKNGTFYFFQFLSLLTFCYIMKFIEISVFLNLLI